MVDDEPIKNLALRTLLDFPGQESRTDFWESLLNDPQYFDTAFLALSLQGWEAGLRFLPQYMRMALQMGLREGVLEIRLSNFIMRYLRPDRLPALRRTLAHLTPDEKVRVQALLQRVLPEALEKMQAHAALPQLAKGVRLDEVHNFTRPLELLLQRNSHG